MPPPRFPPSTFGLNVEIPKGGWFIIERFLAPDIRVGVVGGHEPNQGIYLGDESLRRLGIGEIRRLKTFESGANELKYTFEMETSLWIYKCGDTLPGMVNSDEPRCFDTCYKLKSPGFDRSGVIPYSITRKFKPISMGDSTKEIDAMADLFKPQD